MQVKDTTHKQRIVFTVNGLTKSGKMLFITIPAKIRDSVKKDGVYKVVLEEITDDKN